MARSLSMGQHGELEDLMKDPSNNKVAGIGALKSYVTDLNSNTLPSFLARVCDPDKSCSFSEEGTLCLFEIVARIHGRKVVPHISNMVSTVIRIMSSVSGSLHTVGCSKVVCAISCHSIDPAAPEEEKSRIISSLCHPLSDCLLNSKESISSGSALCLITLVESNNWQFASTELVNDVCLKVSGALEEVHCQTVAHLGLVIALSKKNPLILEPYGRSLIRSGLDILNGSTDESNSQMILSSIEMIYSIMKSLDARIISSELHSIINVMKQFQHDCVPDISTAAFQAHKTANVLDKQKECGDGNSLSLMANYNGHNRMDSHGQRDNVDIRGSCSSGSISYELQSVHSFTDHDGATDSHPSLGQSPGILGSGRARRRLWSNRFDTSHAMPNDDFVHIAGPNDHDSLAVVCQSSHAGLVKLDGRCSDVLRRVVEPCAVCLSAQATTWCSQIPRRRALSDDFRMQLTPRMQLHSCSFCKDSERNGHQLPESPSMRCTQFSRQCTDHLLENDGDVEERKSFPNLIQQNDQWHIQNADFVTEDLKSPTDDGRSDSVCKVPCEECPADNDKVLTGRKKRNASCFAAPIFILIAALLLAWWKGNHKELYVVPT